MTKQNLDDEPTFFVSRRGRQVGINQVDLKGIDVDSVQQADSRPAKKPKSASSKPRSKRSGLTRRTKFAVFGVTLFLLLIPVAIGELVAAQYRSSVPSARSELDKIINQSVLPIQKQSTLSADKLSELTNGVDGIARKMCRGGLLDNMSSLYPRASSAFKACKSNQTKYSSLVSSLRDLEKEARYLEQVDSALKPATTSITDDYAVVSAQATAWMEANSALENISPSSDMRPAHNDLQTHVKAVAENWSKLSQASDSQDATAFTEAEKTLATEYEAVRSSSNGFSEVLKSKQIQLTASYQDLR